MKDNEARNIIITGIRRNCFVEAGAGSGKTTILVERMVAMVEQGIPVERICTITFTKAAANEFYARFQKRLSERSRLEHKNAYHDGELTAQTEETMKRCEEALLNIDSCFMGTIDSFCNMILSEHPLAAAIPADAAVIEDEQIISSYLAEYARILTTDDYPELKHKCQTFIHTQNRPVDVFKAVLSAIIQVRDVEFMYEGVDNESVEDKYAADRKGIIRLLNKLLEDPSVAYDGNGESVKAWEILQQRKNFLTDYDWDDSFSYVLDALNKIRKLRVKPFDGIEDYFGPSFIRLQAHETRNKVTWYELADEGFNDVVDSLKDYQARVALDFTVDCVRQMAPQLKKKGQLTFFDYKLYLRDMLKKDAINGGRLISHIYRRHSYFLIDEFQDTDPMQAEIFFYLAADPDKRLDGDWRKCIPHDGALFIVGDPKQSIYRFKNADVASFKNVRSLFDGVNGDVLQLTSNFRSTYTLHQWFNEVFGRHLLNEDTEDQSRYEDITNKDHDDAYATGVYSYPVSTKGDDTAEMLKIVSTLVDNPDILIDEGKRIQYRDIMIITSGKKDLGKYVTLFTDNHIPFRVEGDIDFRECPALKDLVAVFKAVACTQNNFYVYEALTSGLFDLGDDIMAVRDDLKKVRTTGILDTENERGKEAVEFINRKHEEAVNLSPSTLFSQLIDELQIFALSGSHNVEYVYYTLELLREKENSGEIASLNDAVAYLEDLMNGELDLERCMSLEKNDNRIHLANLHKVKGLEASVVILAGPKKKKRSVNPLRRVEYVGDTPRCYMFGVRKDFTTLTFRDTYNKKDSEKISEEAEIVRQLYVAATRARRLLIIADDAPWKELSGFAAKDFFEEFGVREISGPAVMNQDGALMYHNVRSLIQADAFSLKSSYEIHKPSDIDYDDFTEHPGMINTRKNPRLVGTLVHRLMEIIVMSHDKAEENDTINDLCKDLEDKEYYSAILHEVYRIIHSGGYTQENNSESDILKELLTADEVYCEVPFSYRIDETTFCNGIIDVLYCKGDQWHIVDYKTNADGSSLDDRYEPQLQDYATALKKATGVDADSRIYHIMVE